MIDKCFLIYKTKQMQYEDINLVLGSYITLLSDILQIHFTKDSLMNMQKRKEKKMNENKY